MPAKRTSPCVAVIVLVLVFLVSTLLFIYFSKSAKGYQFIPESYAKLSHHRLKRQQYNACNNYSEVSSISSQNFRNKYRMAQPWPSSSKFFISKNLLYNWNWMKEIKIRGLGVPLSSVIRMYDNNKCLFMPWDAAVRNILLSAQPVPISAELSCSLTRIYSLCKSRFGKSLCHRLPNTSFVLVGDPFDTKSILGEPLNEPLRLYSWKTLSARASHELDYTVNALGLYDDYAGQVVLIDSTGKGFQDSCGRKIRAIEELQSGLGSWYQGNTFYKALRMYDLLSYDMVSTDEQQEFVKAEVKRRFSAEKFECFYCENICEGFFVAAYNNQDTGPFCYLGAERQKDLARRIEKFKVALRNDFQNSLYSVMEARINGISHVNGKLPSSSTIQQSDIVINAKFEDQNAEEKKVVSIPETRTENAFIVMRQAEPYTSTTTITSTTTTSATPKSYLVLRTLAPKAISEDKSSSSTTTTTSSPSTTTTSVASTSHSSIPTQMQTAKTPTTSTSKPPLPSTTRRILSDDDFEMIYYTFTTYRYYNVITPGPPVNFPWKK